MDIIKDLVFNLFFIFICFSILISLEVKKSRLKEMNTKYLALIASIAIVLCITFPIQLTHDLKFDLRLVPIVVAGLYGGWPTILALMFVNIGYRFLWNGSGIYVTMIVAIFHTLFLSVLSPVFLSMSHRKRMTLGAITGFLSSLCLLFVFEFIFNNSLPLLLSVSMVVLQTVGIFLCIFLIEMAFKVRNLQEQIIRTEKMEIVSYLASSFSHEVRNPMTTVRGFLQLMKGSEMNKEKVDSYVSIAISEIDRAESIITEYLSFTKPTSEEIHTINGGALLKNTIEVIRPLANANSIDINYKGCTFFIEGNKPRMQQALINLYKNAIEAMAGGGTLSVIVEAKSEFVEITIGDTGIGMTEDQVRRLGEPYFSTKGEKGTGLGMMVVYNIVESVKGKISVKSQKGKGTTFILTFPKSPYIDAGHENIIKVDLTS